MISVCMATYNGERHVRAQVESILRELGAQDELIVSDDNSTDNTCGIIEAFGDPRIRLLHHRPCGVAYNFENALKVAKGDFVFLSDQDDVWLPGKVKAMTAVLASGDYDYVSSNCTLTDSDLRITKERYYDAAFPLTFSFWRNFVTNHHLGSCCAFNRKVLEAVLPFPDKVYMHDTWITLFSLLHFRCGFVDEPYMYYRRHAETVSFVGRMNTHSLWYKLSYRMRLACQLATRSVQYGTKSACLEKR